MESPENRNRPTRHPSARSPVLARQEAEPAAPSRRRSLVTGSRSGGPREVWVSYDELDELLARAHPENPKKHDLAALDASVERFGYVSPIIINDLDGRILEGHGRVETLLALRASGAGPPPGIRLGPQGKWLVPAVHGIQLLPEEARAFLVAANRITELGGWDESRLAAILGELQGATAGFDGVGFSETDLFALLANLQIEGRPDQKDPDRIPEEPPRANVYVREGQLWQLGGHLLLCGDSTNGEHVARLLGGRRAELALTDPPYNVRYGDHGGASGWSSRRLLPNDSLSPAEWERFVRGWSRELLASVDGAIYVFMSGKEWPTVSRILEEEGGHWSTTIIWAKDRFVLGRADYQRQYEPMWYGWREGARRHWCGDRNQGDVWLIPRPAASELHPTMKPVALIERAIANSSTAGGRVLDLFLGSGTTLIAAERLGRRCLGMEIDPIYVQVAIERWQRYTGRTARLEE